MTQPSPSPEAMRAAQAIIEARDRRPTLKEIHAAAARIDDAFRPLRESHERLRVASRELISAGVEAALACRIYQCEAPAKQWDAALQGFRAALAQVPR